MTKLCSKCKNRKETTEFSFKNKASGTRRADCKECCKTNASNHYIENKESYKNGVLKRRKLAREWILGFLSVRACVDCSITDIRVLEFDHTSDNKLYDVGLLVNKGYGISTIKTEVEKCEVVCSNCHRIRTCERSNSYRQVYFNKEELSEPGLLCFPAKEV